MSEASLTASLEDIRTRIAEFSTDPYLLTVTAQHRPHCATVTVDWGADGTRMVVAAPSSWPGSDSNGLRNVTLLWPPDTPGGYSLIVDGTASHEHDDSARLAVAPTRAVLHRRGPAPEGAGSSCGSDCVPIFSG